jgi:hypothetical protein
MYPVPGATKTQHVRYLYQGKEGTVEVTGEKELRLPPLDAVDGMRNAW